jgi:peptidoglycan/LPS O-acetylase OafA/YrhL
MVNVGRQSEVLAGPQPSSPTEPRRRLDYVDGLRALAALWILLGHTIETSKPQVTMGLPVIGPIVQSAFFGQVAVIVFLVLSGFCLYFPVVRRNPAAPVLGVTYATYLSRRARRILPPYFAAAVICFAVTTVPGIQIGRWAETTPIDVWVILSHLTMVHNLIPTHATKIDYPMWTLGLEWQLYLFFPLLVWAFRRFGGIRVLVVCTAIMIVDRLTYHRLPEALSHVMRDGPVGYVSVFASGMLTAVFTLHRRIKAPVWLLGGLAVAGLVVVRSSRSAGFVHDLGAVTTAASTLLLAIDPRSGISRLLQTPWLVAIGHFSYSLYLIHAPCVHLTWLALRELHLSDDATFYLLVLFGAPLSIGAAYGFHRLFELPFMNTRPEPLKVKAEWAV